MVLKISDISKAYDRKNKVLTNVNMEISPKECHSLIGKNGAGKSTLINIIIDLVEADSGQVEIFSNKNEVSGNYKKYIGVLPELNPLIEEFNLRDYLEYVGLIYRLDEQLIKRRSDYLIDYFFDEEQIGSKVIGEFSKGMKLKAGICAALINKPKVLILDEPFEGLDIFSAKNLVTFLNDYRDKGNAILVSSHDMLFIEKISTNISVIKQTEVFNYTVAEIEALQGNFEESITGLLGYDPKEIKEFI